MSIFMLRFRDTFSGDLATRLVNAVITLRIPWQIGNFFANWRTLIFSRRDLFQGVRNLPLHYFSSIVAVRTNIPSCDDKSFFFCLLILYNALTDLNVHPISYPVGTGGFSLEVKSPGREADYSPQASAEIKKMWIYTSTPPYTCMA
jgi:hypothetical protein